MINRVLGGRGMAVMEIMKISLKMNVKNKNMT